jgi:hypothetical protein
MDSSKPRVTPSSFSPVRDVENLKQNGAASLEELKEFLGNLQGRSPQEVVGIVSTSLLVQSMVLSTVGVLAVLAIFTVGPYFVYGPPKEKRTAAAPPPAAAPVEAAAPSEAGKAGEPSEADKTKALQKLGVDETKDADPQSNPLEKNLDKLLDDVK